MLNRAMAAAESMPFRGANGLPIGKARNRLLPHRQVPERFSGRETAAIVAFGKRLPGGDRHCGGRIVQ